MTQSILYVVFAFGWLALPLIPAFKELLRPTDNQALAVFHGNGADAQEGVHLSLPHAYAAPSEGSSQGPAHENLTTWEPSELCAYSVAQLPDVGPLHLVSTGGLTLRGRLERPASVHARSLTLAAGTRISSRLSALESAHLHPDTKFQVLQAPVIRTLPGVAALLHDGLCPHVGPHVSDVRGASYQSLQGWWKAPGSASVPTTRQVLGDIVANGDISVEEDALVQGSLKARGTVTLHPGARVTHNIVANAVVLARNTLVGGTVLADTSVSLGEGAQVGTAASPASVCAEFVELQSGVVIFGGITAHGHARVSPTQSL